MELDQMKWINQISLFVLILPQFEKTVIFTRTIRQTCLHYKLHKNVAISEKFNKNFISLSTQNVPSWSIRLVYVENQVRFSRTRSTKMTSRSSYVFLETHILISAVKIKVHIFGKFLSTGKIISNLEKT